MLPADQTMLSRVADSIYWMSRYVERAENVARFISVNLQSQPRSAGRGGAAVVAAGRDHGRRQPICRALSPRRPKRTSIQFLTFDHENPNSILSCLRAARENARSVREIISPEMWEHINKFYLMRSATAARSSTCSTIPTSSSSR